MSRRRADAEDSPDVESARRSRGRLSCGPGRERGRADASRPRPGVRGPLSRAQQRRQDPGADPGPGRDRRRAWSAGARRSRAARRSRSRRRSSSSAGWRRIVVGRDPRDVRGAWTRHARRDLLGRQRRASSRSASAPSTWRSGTSRARSPGVPLHALLGEQAPAPIPACASTILATGDLERVGREFRGLRRPGLPLRQGRLGPRPVDRLRARRARDLAVARAVRDAVGPDDRDDPGRRGAGGLGREPRHPDVPGARRRRAACTGSRIRWSSRTSTATGGSGPPSTPASAPARRAGTRSTTRASSSPARST